MNTELEEIEAIANEYGAYAVHALNGELLTLAERIRHGFEVLVKERAQPTHDIIANLRNPYGLSAKAVEETRLAAANAIERLQRELEDERAGNKPKGESERK